MNPKVEYNVYDTYDFFEQEIERVKESLVERVNNKEIDPVEARKRLDMYLSMMIYLQIGVSMAETDKMLKKDSFGSLKRKATGERKGKPDLIKVARALYK